MPEGPELKFIEQRLSILKGKKIKDLIMMNISRGAEPDGHNELIGQKIYEINTHGKNLYIICDYSVIYIHLMLSGYIKTYENIDMNINDEISSFHIALFTDTDIIYVYDKMNIMRYKIMTMDEYQSDISEYGPDIYNITLDKFMKICNKKKNSMIHSWLVDQRVIAGIGNYLKAEILFCAKINPFKKTKNIDDNILEELFHCMKQIINDILMHKIKHVNYDLIIYRKDSVDNHEIIKEKNIYWVPELQVN